MPTSLTTLETLIAGINSVVTTYCTSIKTVTLGYIGEVATGQTVYDVLLLLPPKAKIPEPRNWNRKEYEIRYFLIRQDVGSAGGYMTHNERVTCWGALEAVNKTFITWLMSTNVNYQVVGEITIDPNSGGGDQMLPDKVIWLEVTLTLRVNDC